MIADTVVRNLEEKLTSEVSEQQSRDAVLLPHLCVLGQHYFYCAASRRLLEDHLRMGTLAD